MRRPNRWATWLVFFAWTTLASSGERGQRETARAESLIEAEDFTSALGVLRAVLDEEPDNSEALRLLAPLLMGLGRDDEALEAYDRLAFQSPEDSNVAIPLGILLARKGQFQRSLETLNAVLERDEDSFEAHHYLGTVYSAMGEAEKALKHLDRAIALDPDHGLSLYEKAMLYSKQEKLDEALDLLKAAREKLPENGLVRFRIGEIYVYESDLESAERELREALRLDRSLNQARAQLGAVFYQGRRFPEAADVLLEAVRFQPDDAESHHLLARAYVALERAGEAREHFERALSLDPFLSNAYLNYGNFLRRQGEAARGEEFLRRFQELRESDKAIVSLERLQAFDPDNEETKRELIKRLLSDGRVAVAYRYAEQFLAAKPKAVQSHVNLAMVHLTTGRFAEARNILEAALRLDASSAALYGLLGDAHLGLESVAAAVRSYERAAELEATSVWLYKLGAVHMRRGDRSKAAASFEQAIHNDAGDALPVNALAVLRLDDGDLARGIVLLERAIELDPQYVAAHRNLGEAYLRAGRESEGEKELALAEELERKGRESP